MFSKRWQQRSALFLLIAYSVDSVWKLAHWGEFTSVVRSAEWWGIPLFALALAIRFAVMGFCLWAYLYLRRTSQKSQ